MIRMVDAPRGKKLRPKFDEKTQKKHFEIGKMYNKMSTIEHNRQMGALNRKIMLKQEAIMALPESLKKSAMIIDQTTVPLRRPIPAYTPPIKDFNPNEFASMFGAAY
mmetsp:Transcript_30401/g.40135  ORF Transcript_30401/g.40135 Transcript_30401/m.40135 type:complete len:107 (+) Transcript_30401:121-441(+)